MEQSHIEVLAWLNGYIEGITQRNTISKKEVTTLIEKLEYKLSMQEPFEPQEFIEDDEDEDLPFN